jgi:hypothetical protein
MKPIGTHARLGAGEGGAGAGGRGQAAIAAGAAGQGPGGGRGRQGMPVLYDAGGSGEADGGGVQVGGRRRASGRGLLRLMGAGRTRRLT